MAYPTDKPSRHGVAWSAAEDRRLLSALRRGVSLESVLCAHQRTHASIHARLSLLMQNFQKSRGYCVTYTGASIDALIADVRCQPSGFSRLATQIQWGALSSQQEPNVACTNTDETATPQPADTKFFVIVCPSDYKLNHTIPMSRAEAETVAAKLLRDSPYTEFFLAEAIEVYTFGKPHSKRLKPAKRIRKR
jgi:hypothetical protein